MKKKIIQNPNNECFEQWIFYDGQCPLCINLARQARGVLNSRGFGLTPLQTTWVSAVTAHLEDPLKEMLIQTTTGQLIGGADAVIYLSKHIWWTRGIYVLAQLPGVRRLLRMIYAKIAANRYCLSDTCKICKLGTVTYLEIGDCP